MRVTAAILAAGRGERFGADKTGLILGDRPVWRWSYDTYSQHPGIDETFLVTAETRRPDLERAFPGVRFVTGGETRQQSSKAALEAAVGADVLLLHDAARPFVSPGLIGAVIQAIHEHRAAAAGCGVTDTIRQVTAEGLVTLPRNQLISMQTPQGALTSLLREAHCLAEANLTDDMALLEKVGVQPVIVPGETSNFKITLPEDFQRAEDYERSRAFVRTETRTGMGYDVHPFSDDPTRTLWLGGVAFPGHRALDGHSDADVLLHAATDALLGAGALGDIGQHFPNTDPRWKGAPSLHFLRHAKALLTEAGWQVVNLDLTCIAEEPKIMKRSDEIRAAIAEALDTSPSRISIKATTNERLGFVGRGEGIAALATATITHR